MGTTTPDTLLDSPTTQEADAAQRVADALLGHFVVGQTVRFDASPDEDRTSLTWRNHGHVGVISDIYKVNGEVLQIEVQPPLPHFGHAQWHRSWFRPV